MLAGETPEEAVAAVTEEEVQGVRPPEPESEVEPEKVEAAAEPEEKRGLFGRRWFQQPQQGYYGPRGNYYVAPRGY